MYFVYEYKGLIMEKKELTLIYFLFFKLILRTFKKMMFKEEKINTINNFFILTGTIVVVIVW
jgi:hypothetical protein